MSETRDQHMTRLIQESGVDFSDLEKAGLRMEARTKSGCGCLDEAAFKRSIENHAAGRAQGGRSRTQSRQSAAVAEAEVAQLDALGDSIWGPVPSGAGVY